MIRGITDKGDIKTAKMTENGELMVAMSGDGGESEFPTEIEINNTSSNPIPTNITNEGIGINNTSSNPVPVTITDQAEVETTISAGIQTVGTTASSISINKKVTEIDIANFSETATVTLTIGNDSYVIGSSIATTLKINKTLTSISIVASAANTDVQLIIKGVE